MKRLIALAATWILAGCTASTGVPPTTASVHLFYNNDNIGYLEPCGCRVVPIGGMDRRWNAMMQVPKERRVFVDAGNMLFKSNSPAEHLKPQWREQALGVVEAYNLLNADAAVPGETDFALGVKEFESLAAKAKFSWIAANLFVKATGKPFLRESLLIERGGKKIGIFGLVNPALQWPVELEARGVEKIAQAVVNRLRGQGAETVVLLSHGGLPWDKWVASAVSGIDVIVGASTQSLLQDPERVGDTTIVQLSSQGMFLGVLELGKGREIVASRVEELDSRWDLSSEENPMKALRDVTNIRIAEANKKFDETLWSRHETAGVKSYDTFLSCRECHTVQAEFQERTPHAAAFLTLLAKKKENDLDCVKCHSVGMGAKGGFRTLADAFRGASDQVVPWAQVKKHVPVREGHSYRKDPGSIPADVEKFVQGLQRAGVKKAFVSVQCENCHGPRAGHPFQNVKAQAVTSQTCIQCHTPEQMPSWWKGKTLNEDVWRMDLKKVTCPKEK